MGWNSAGDIFDPIAREVVNSSMGPGEQQRLLEVVILKLQEGDWDTESESLDLFMQYPQVVAAFETCGIYPYGDPRNDY